MEPDGDSPVSRMERTFWTVWLYVTGAVNRFLRPEPNNINTSDSNSFQESAVNSESADNDHTEGDTSKGEVDEELPLATASPFSSSGAVVASELCIMKDTDLGQDEKCTEHQTQLSGGNESKVSEEGESTRERYYSQTENDDIGLLTPRDTRAEKAEEEENVHQKLYTHTQVESPKNVEDEENAKRGSLTPTDDGMSENAKEETQRTMTPEDHEKMDETMGEIHATEEGNKIHHEDEQVLEEEEDIEIQLCTTTDSGLEEEDNMHMEEARVQDDTATAVTHAEVDISNGVLQLVSEYENKSDKEETADKQISVCELWSESDTGVKGDTGKEEMMAHGESGQAEDEQEEEEEESMLHEREQCEEENMNEAENEQTIDEEPEQEEDIKTVREDSQEKHILTECVACSIDDLQNAEPVLHTAEFTYEEEEEEEEEEDVAKNSEMQSKTREIYDVGAVVDEKLYVTKTVVSVNETFFEKNRVEEKRLSSDNKEGYMETACTHTSITVEPEAEAGQEISGELKNISLRICEGEVVVSQKLNSPTCEETQEGVPEYNNEPGPDENSTHRFLEVVDCEEIQSTQLPEEVGSQESESLQNIGADYSLLEEHRKEQQESTEDNNEEHGGILHHTHTRLLQETEMSLTEQLIKELDVLYEEEEGKLLVHSTKTEIEHSEKELETHVGLTDESDETAAERHNGTEELLVKFETDEGFNDFREALGDGHETTGAVTEEEAVGFAEETSKFVDAEEQKMADTSFFQESIDTISFDQDCNMTPSLLEDITSLLLTGLLKQSIEPQTVEDCTVDTHDVDVIDSGETGYVLEEAAGDEIQNKNQMGILNLQLVTPLEETDKNESALIARSEADEAFEMSNEETLTDTEAADELMTAEFKPKDAAVISTEEMVKHVTESERTHAKEESSSISGNQDVIDEEILDLWIQAASSENTDDMKQQEGPEQLDVKIQQSSEERAEISSVQTETEKEQLVKLNSGESGLLSNTELSSLTAESGFLDQSVCVWDTQNNENQPLKSADMESFQDIYDTLSSISESADISHLSTHQFQSESQDILIEKAAETGQSEPSSEVRQEISDREQVELVKTEIQKDSEAEITDLASKTDWKDAEESDFKSPTEEAEKTNFEDEAFEIMASHSPNEFKAIQSGQSKSGLEVLSEEGVMSIEPGLQVDTWTESEMLFELPSFEKPQPGWSEDSAESLPERNRAEMVEQLTTKSEGLIEVDASTLDFTAQRSRIAVKNPHVRPPTDARSLLHMPSVEPTPSSNLPVKVPAGVPLAGLGIGIKLPGLGAGFPVLKKTQRVVREENSPETLAQEPKAKPEDKSDTPKQDEVQHKPKWMPPKQAGFGNPLMSELKTKLKKPTKE